MKTNFKKLLLMFLATLACGATLGAKPSLGADVLYVADVFDNTVKRFNAETGAALDGLGAFVQPDSGGLDGPRGILFDATGNLLVANQNVNLKISGDILRYSGQTGQFLGALVPSSDKNAPFAPQGIVIDSKLYVANLTAAGNTSSTGSVKTYDPSGNFLGDLAAKGFPNHDNHPRAIVFGPDGKIYVSVRDLDKEGLGGSVLRFNADGSFDKVFITDTGGVGQLNRPQGLVFGPNGNLYITSFRANPGDTDSIRIYSAAGQFLSKIDLYTVGSQPRAFAQALLFGPNGCLFVPISNTGEVRRYNVGGTCSASLPFESFISAGGSLKQPWFLTFGSTNPKTLVYQ
jgi:DNA-binding beta-propeller fold protein YncE